MTVPATASLDVRDAYRQCEQITRQQAKNFSYGIALLPACKRRALSAVYAFARRIDDIGDGSLPAADKVTELERARADVTALAGRGLAGQDAAALIPCWPRWPTRRAGTRSRSRPSAS